MVDVFRGPPYILKRNTVIIAVTEKTIYLHSSMVICNHSALAPKLLPYLIKDNVGEEKPVGHGILNVGNDSVHVIEAVIDGVCHMYLTLSL